MINVHLIAAARPNFMKVAPLFHALNKTDWAKPVLVHTGQHHDHNMSDTILRDLKVPAPDFHLGVGSGSHAEQMGNVMIDSFEMLRDTIEAANTREQLGLTSGDYALVTLHRPSNVDAAEALAPIVAALVDASQRLPIVFVAQPRTIKGLEKFNLTARLSESANIKLLEPLPYVQFMNIVTGAKVVITDSGGLQEETTYLGIPCLTLRENTERPITVSIGTNKLIDASILAENLTAILDGKTAARAVEALKHRSGL